MALCYLARRIGVSVLRRASAPRVAQPAGTPRRLASSSYQDGHINGARVGATKESADAELRRAEAEFKAQCEALKKTLRQSALHRHYLIVSVVGGVGMAMLTIGYTTYNARKRIRALASMME